MPSTNRVVRSGTTDRRFEALLLASADIVWWADGNGEFVEEQPYWREYTGQTWEEYRGSGWLAVLHPDDAAAITADWYQAITRGLPYFTQGRIRSAKHNAYRTFQARGIPVRNDSGRVVEWLGTLTDIQDTIDIRTLPERTESDLASSIQALRSSEAHLRESEERFRTMANSAPVLIWMAGLDKLCTFFNQVWLDFTGRPMEAEMGNGWVEGVHPDDAPKCFEAYSSAFDARRRFEIDYRLRRHDGEYRWVIDVGVPRFDSNGDFCGYIGSAIDITDRRQAEENDRRFARMQRLALIGELSAAVVHELRQPLSAIKLNAMAGEQVLRSPEPSFREIQEIVTDISADASRADHVIDRIRRFLGRLDPDEELIDMGEIVAEAAGIVSDEAQNRHVRLELRLSHDRFRVRGDRTQIMQVLLNLILNGMASMDGVNSGDRRLTLRTRRRVGAVEVSVSDCGTGITPEIMPQVFESFFTTKSDGMGMGLSIAKTIINAHHGRIWAENNPNNGATFYFTLPRFLSDH